MTALIIPITDKTSSADYYLDNLLWSIQIQELDKQFPIYPCWDSCKDKFIETFYHRYPFMVYDSKLINTGNPLRFSGNVNNGLRLVHSTTNHNVIVVNQDTILPQDLNKLDGEGICSPTQVTIEKETKEDILLELNMLQNETLERHKHIKVTGFCLFINRNVMDKIGYLDTYFPGGYDDNDYSVRTQLAGLPVESVSVYVHHYVSKLGAYGLTANSNNSLILQKQKYYIKWSIPLSIPDDGSPEKYILEKHIWEPEMKVL